MDSQLKVQPDDISRTALKFGIIGFIFFFMSIAAIRASILYKKQHDGKQCSQSLAGMICGIVSLVLWVVGIVLVICLG